MKKKILSLLFALLTTAGLAQNAANFSCNDCNGTYHDLFSELNSEKVIVLCWVMPCAVCVGPSLTTYNVVQSYRSSHPGKVFFYLVDDYANTPCISLNSWATSNGLSNDYVFSDASIDMTPYSGAGMPKIVVLGGINHNVFYIGNNTVDYVALKAAIDLALETIGIAEDPGTISSVDIYPNPADRQLNLRYTLSQAFNGKINLLNSFGQMMESVATGPLTAGIHQLEFQADTYPEGLYFLQFIEGNKTKTLKVQVVH